MGGAQVLSNRAGGIGLVVRRVLETDGEGSDLAGAGGAHERNHQTGIEPATEECPQWDVTDQAVPHRRSEQLGELLLQRVRSPP